MVSSDAKFQASGKVVRLSCQKILRILFTIFLVLLGLHLVQLVIYQVSGVHIRKLDFNNERNLPTYFATIELFLCAYFLGWITKEKFQLKERFRFHWRALSFIFYFLMLDEFFQIHDSIGLDWFKPYSFLLLIFALAYIPFLLHLPQKTRWWMVFSGFLYVLGAIVFEIIGLSIKNQYGWSHLYYKIITTIEESLEMLGLILFIYTLLVYGTKKYGKFLRSYTKFSILIEEKEKSAS